MSLKYMSSSLFPNLEDGVIYSSDLKIVHQTPSLLQGEEPAFAMQLWELVPKFAKSDRAGAH